MAFDPQAKDEIRVLIHWCRQTAIEVSRNRPDDPQAAGERCFQKLIARLTAVGLGGRVEKMKPGRWSTIERTIANLTNWADQLEQEFHVFWEKSTEDSLPAAAKPSGQDHDNRSSEGTASSTSSQGLTQFTGGTMEFWLERVLLCGVDICSGRRSKSRRQILELLSRKSDDGTFLPYSGGKLAALVDLVSIGGAIRDLRNQIQEALCNQANSNCGYKDVILGGGPGYRFAEWITVQPEDTDESMPIMDIRDTNDVADVHCRTSSNVPDDLDDPAKPRRAWILERLADGAELKVPDVVRQFSCSPKTAQRDLSTLKGEGKIEYVGSPRTGHYRLCTPAIDASKSRR